MGWGGGGVGGHCSEIAEKTEITSEGLPSLSVGTIVMGL